MLTGKHTTHSEASLSRLLEIVPNFILRCLSISKTELMQCYRMHFWVLLNNTAFLIARNSTLVFSASLQLRSDDANVERFICWCYEMVYCLCIARFNAYITIFLCRQFVAFCKEDDHRKKTAAIESAKALRAVSVRAEKIRRYKVWKNTNKGKTKRKPTFQLCKSV